MRRNNYLFSADQMKFDVIPTHTDDRRNDDLNFFIVKDFFLIDRGNVIFTFQISLLWLEEPVTASILERLPDKAVPFNEMLYISRKSPSQASGFKKVDKT